MLLFAISIFVKLAPIMIANIDTYNLFITYLVKCQIYCVLIDHVFHQYNQSINQYSYTELSLNLDSVAPLETSSILYIRVQCLPQTHMCINIYTQWEKGEKEMSILK